MTVSKGIPYPLGMTVTGEREINLAAVGRQKKEWGLVLYPKDGGDPIRLPFEAQHRLGDVTPAVFSGMKNGGSGPIRRFLAAWETNPSAGATTRL